MIYIEFICTHLNNTFCRVTTIKFLNIFSDSILRIDV